MCLLYFTVHTVVLICELTTILNFIETLSLKNCQGNELQKPVENYSCADEEHGTSFTPAGADFLLCYAAENSTYTLLPK